VLLGWKREQQVKVSSALSANNRLWVVLLVLKQNISIAQGLAMDDKGTIPPAVVVTMSYSGLAIVRSLARRGVKVYAVASSKDEVGMASRYARPIVFRNILRSERDTVRGLLNLAQIINRSAVLFPTGDALVLPISRNRKILSKYYKFLMPEQDIVEKLISKEGLAGIIEKGKLPGPRSKTIVNKAELDCVSRAVTYPILMKPAYSASWYLPELVKLIGVRKAIVVESRNQLEQLYGIVMTVDPRVILQEIIPGEDSRLYYICGYFNEEGKLEAVFAGQKLRVTPIHFGSASFVKSVRDETLLKATVDLMEPLGYKGLFGVEFKKDIRDGIFKIIEVNVRWGLWDGLAGRCGIDLAYLAYAREAGLPYKVNPIYRTGVKWLCFRRDLDAYLDYRKEGLLTIRSWIKSLLGETEHAVFAWDDLCPIIFECRDIIRQKGKSLLARLRER
jgi:predicted ATP-grasp superfamily ATP-dependent carboligase